MSFNIETFLRNNNIGYRTSGKNVSKGEYSICCLWCGENKYHLGVNPSKGLFNCWKCSEKGNIVRLVAKIKNISFIEAKEIINPTSELKKVLEERNKIVEESIIIQNKDFKLPEHTYRFRKDKTDLWQETAFLFLRQKYGLTWNDVEQANLHYCVYGKWKNSIIIPVYKDKKLINFLGRCWDKNSKVRYNICPNEKAVLNIHKTLYNIDSIKIGQDLLVLVEGVFDCLKVGLNIAVASFGTEVSQEQRNLLIGLKPKKLIILADNDLNNPNTIKKAQKLCDYLSPFSIIKCIKVPFKGKDPADLDKEELANLLYS